MVNNSNSASGNGKKHNGAASPQTDITDAESLSVAAYIADLTAEMAQLAARGKLPMLAYFLNLARVEAQMYVREHGRQGISGES
ncbi:hypothetical protein [Methylocystis heyeri]|uniref:Uncharacterized protein n=1 Tax=Methylocystis heyeri TaxID=391905 RepID=A0A6B8KC97_9HYPH|nr:hypothetical protein [Methylocystis heyeri]QGM45309.1 hypothetical protein H2LOC_006145 [Methylocystis heyeri]